MKRRSTKLIILICLIAIAVIIGLFVFIQSMGSSPSDIRMPDPAAADSSAAPSPVDSSAGNADITTDNVLSVIRLLSRADSYRQEYTLNGSQTVTVCHRSDITGVVSLIGEREKHTILTGDRVYIWYQGDTDYYEGPLGTDFSADDAMGIPTYETLLHADSIVEAGYEYPDHPAQSCIYVKTVQNGCSESYWISCDTGLLVMFEAVQDGECIFSMTQTAIQYPLTTEDTFADVFTLPDGTDISQEQ